MFSVLYCTCDWIPSLTCLEPVGATAGVISSRYISEYLWMLVDEWVQETQWRLALREASIVEEADDASEGGAGAAGT